MQSYAFYEELKLYDFLYDPQSPPRPRMVLTPNIFGLPNVKRGHLIRFEIEV